MIAIFFPARRKLCVVFLIILFVFSFYAKTRAEEQKNNLAYKLAALHTLSLPGGKGFFDSSIEPENATVTEFQWLIDTLKNRCIEDEASIADTILSAWRLIKNRGYEMSLLETARAMTSNANNKFRFGDKKVECRRTTGYWTSHDKPEKK